MIPAARANALLDALLETNDQLSLHSAFSASGANEITTGSDDRVTVLWDAAASRTKSSTAGNYDIAVPAGSTVAWIGVFNEAGDVFKGMIANGGAEKSFQLDLTNNRVYCEGHGMANNDRIVFTGATVPAGLTEGTAYHVVGVTAGDPDYLQVAATQGGAAIDITGQHSADARLSKIVFETYAADGTHRVTSFSQAL